MKRLVSTRNLSKEDWLRYRKCGITGTDAGAILGLNPYRSAFQVYHDKISDTIENIDNEAMRQGRDLEDYVAQRFTEATGLKVRRANAIYQSEEHPLLLADFDRLIVGQKAGLECKTVSPFSADKWADGKIPAHYLAQVDHYLAVSGFDCWYVAALIFGRELVIHKIVTDKQVLSDELFTVDDSDVNAATQTASAESSSTARSIPSEVLGCEKDGTWQKILVEATGSNATLTLWTYRDGQWEKDLSTTAAIGANGLTTDKTEGDHMTPEGTFPICFAFSTKEKNTMLYSKIIKEDSVWVCDPESIYYNTLQSKNNPQKDWADKGGAENMYVKFSKGSSNACICFGFNGDGESTYSATPYAGSALFIDGVGENGNMNSGYGDIKISGKDMTKLLSYLCENDNPVITIKSAQ